MLDLLPSSLSSLVKFTSLFSNSSGVIITFLLSIGLGLGSSVGSSVGLSNVLTYSRVGLGGGKGVSNLVTSGLVLIGSCPKPCCWAGCSLGC